MASGCAAISFDCDAGPRDIIAHGQNGLLVSPVGDVDNLAAAMLALMTNDAERALMASRAPAVQQMFSPRKVLAMWQDVFDQTGASHLRSVDSLRVNE
jgi:glycosyltransferase involved in cell wall biosynthesis